MPTIIIKNGPNSFFLSFSRKIVMATKIEKTISPLERIDALTAVDSFNPKNM